MNALARRAESKRNTLPVQIGTRDSCPLISVRYELEQRARPIRLSARYSRTKQPYSVAADDGAVAAYVPKRLGQPARGKNDKRPRVNVGRRVAHTSGRRSVDRRRAPRIRRSNIGRLRQCESRWTSPSDGLTSARRTSCYRIFTLSVDGRDGRQNRPFSVCAVEADWIRLPQRFLGGRSWHKVDL